MAVTPPPRKKPAPAEEALAPKMGDKEIEAIINRGSSSVGTSQPTPDQLKNFNIRIAASTLVKIDAVRAERPRKPTSPKLGISTQDWLAEAISEKLEREQKRYNLGVD